MPLPQPLFFGPSWINKVIEFEESEGFPATQWKIARKINGQNDQGSVSDWEDFDHAPMEAMGVFECVNYVDPGESAVMKIYMQIPYQGSFFPEEWDQQAKPDAIIAEHIALLTLTQKGCVSSPRLINWKRETQSRAGILPGGYIVYLVLEKLPGIMLNREAYWNLSRERRDEIRNAFKFAYDSLYQLIMVYRDCVSHGTVPVEGTLDTNVLWDEATKKIYIISFRDSCRTTEEDVWGANTWLAWKFAECRPEVTNMSHPLPPRILEDGSINEDLWRL